MLEDEVADAHAVIETPPALKASRLESESLGFFRRRLAQDFIPSQLEGAKLLSDQAASFNLESVNSTLFSFDECPFGGLVVSEHFLFYEIHLVAKFGQGSAFPTGGRPAPWSPSHR